MILPRTLPVLFALGVLTLMSAPASAFTNTQYAERQALPGNMRKALPGNPQQAHPYARLSPSASASDSEMARRRELYEMQQERQRERNAELRERYEERLQEQRLRKAATPLPKLPPIPAAPPQTVAATGNQHIPQARLYGQPSEKPLDLTPGFRLDTNLHVGYRTENFRWNISGNSNGCCPNILSELEWSDIQSVATEAEIHYVHEEGMLRGLQAEIGVMATDIFDGDNQDSDYFSDNRANEFSRSNNSSNTGWGRRYRGWIGYPIYIGDKMRGVQFDALTAFVGYQLSENRYVMRDGFQTIPATGPFANLKSRYESEWKGPFAGLTYEAIFGNNQLRVKGAYHRGDYMGVGNWNLRNDFQHPRSFEQTADAEGWTFGLSYGYNIWRNLLLTGRIELEFWNGDGGRDTVFFANNTIVNTQFREVKWSTQTYSMGLAYRF